MIEIKRLSKVYKSDKGEFTAIKDISLKIEDGEIYGIIGLSGAGKSSLLRCINMLERPTGGSVIIDGVDMTGLDEKGVRDTRKKIGIIFQHFNLLMNSTVYDNIAFPMKLSGKSRSEIKSKVQSLLEVVNLADKADSYPAQLSGGEKQRVGIARALSNDPSILLCDEATSALDPSTTDSILSLIKDINHKLGITVVIITHEMDVIKKICGRVAVLEKGTIAEENRTFELISSPKSETAKRFLLSEDEGIDEIPSELSSGEVLARLKYTVASAIEPVISDMLRATAVTVNILTGSLEKIQGHTIGNLLISVSGNANDVKSAIDYLVQRGVNVEVISDDRIRKAV